MKSFNPDSIKTFKFTNYSFNSENFEATFNFAFDSKYFFTETIKFPKLQNISKEKLCTVNRLLSFLHVMIGISYYKAACPKEIQIENNILNNNSAKFFDKIYTLGLGEFSYVNNKPIKIKFPSNNVNYSRSYKIEKSNSILLPIGGGKDSLVSYELLKKLNNEINFFYVGKSKLVENLVKKTNEKFINVKREICPNLIKLNKNGALNGHIPITAINSFISIISCVLYDINSIYFSNERSSNSGNTEFHNLNVNHQYSKSFEFENDLTKLIKDEFKVNVQYYSLLRPVSEVLVFKKFSKLDQYFNLFSSCNTNFKLLEKSNKLWCCKCPKCAFVFIMLANYLTKEKMISIFGENLLENESLISLYEELSGFKNFKPFECVGEIEEVQYAIFNLKNNNNWNESKVIKFLLNNYSTDINEKKFESLKLEELNTLHNLPPDIYDFLAKELK